jgi:hypothetical protein
MDIDMDDNIDTNIFMIEKKYRNMVTKSDSEIKLK